MQDDPKINDFFVHSTYRFLIFVTRSKEIHERTATENFKPELPAFQFQICRTCKWFQCITHHMSNFPVPLFFMQNRSIIILWCFDWKLHALTISNGLLIDNRWSRTYNSVIWAAFVIFQWSLLNFQCFKTLLSQRHPCWVYKWWWQLGSRCNPWDP